jgi:hypothetical protein
MAAAGEMSVEAEAAKWRARRKRGREVSEEAIISPGVVQQVVELRSSAQQK